MTAREKRLKFVVWVTPILFALIFRVIGLAHDQFFMLHPDERFFVQVLTSIQLPQSVMGWFDPAISPMNPANQGFPFYVYGDFPLFLYKLIFSLFKIKDQTQIVLAGRLFSVFFDVGTLICIGVMAKSIWKDDRSAFFSMMGYASFVGMIQQSHYFTVDSLAVFWGALFLTLLVLRFGSGKSGLDWGGGVILGLACATKISSALLSIFPLVFLFVSWCRDKHPRWESLFRLFVLFFAAVLTFRVFQPFSFQSGNLLNWRIDATWLDSMKELALQSGGMVRFPPAWQWATRPLFYAWINLGLYGFGLPMTLLLGVGIVLIFRRKNDKIQWLMIALLIGSFLFLLFQLFQFSKMMRYLYPICPVLFLTLGSFSALKKKWLRVGVLFLSGLSLVWTVAFVGMLLRPHTRVQASEWIYEHIPAERNENLMVTVERPRLFPIELPSSAVPRLIDFESLTVLSGQNCRLKTEICMDSDCKEVLRANDTDVTVSARILFPDEVLLEQGLHWLRWSVIGEDCALVSTREISLYYLDAGEPRFLILHPNAIGENRNNRIAVETVWDESLPLPIDGRSEFFTNSVNLDLFAPEDYLFREKLLARLDVTDWLVIGSNRVLQAARIPDQFPILNALYRELFHCPDGESLTHCFSDFEVDVTENKDETGFSIAKVFSSEPSILRIQFNTQMAEEAFSVYDHPKVLIFRRGKDFELKRFRELFDAVRISAISEKKPVEYKHMEKILPIMSFGQAQTQTQGGTWHVLFPLSAIWNQNQAVGVVIWYLVFLFIGIIWYPASSLFFRALRDRGWAVSRLLGLILMGYVIWLVPVLGGSYSKSLISSVVGGSIALNALLLVLNWRSVKTIIQKRWKHILNAELVFLICFVFFLLIRLGNPDLWHPYKGGEKPMDFSYFNAVLKSSIFPPYDPWFAGGTLSYYYYGFFLAGIVVKWVGFIPSFAYNLILPTWFALLGIGAFSFGSSIIEHMPNKKDFAVMGGWLSVVLLQLIGNQGTIKMFFDGLIRLGTVTSPPPATFFQTITSFFRGIGALMNGQKFMFYPGDWYWLPSRAIPGEPITEFPYFTFLYGDPHAHLFALPITMLVLIWIVALIFSHQRLFMKRVVFLWIGALITSSLLPTNTWDMPTYALLSCAAIIYMQWQHPLIAKEKTVSLYQRAVSIVLALSLYLIPLFLFFQPYLRASNRESGIMLWHGDRTPIWALFLHWGLFLVSLLGWYVVEMGHWLDETKYLSFRITIRKYRFILIGLFLLGVGIGVGLLSMGVTISVIVLPMMALTLILLLKPGRPDSERVILFLSGTSMFIMLFVELFALQGDYGRMNMVFKLYLQVWVMFSLVAAYAIAATWHDRVFVRWNTVYQFMVMALLIGPILFLLFGSFDKITDRMSKAASHSLDGMTYMKTSSYVQDEIVMDLSQDYAAIQWMQQHVEGSPVIIEGHATEYKWGNRFAIYTGLPSVLGWNYHQRQQRGMMSDEVWKRAENIKIFYNTADIDIALSLIHQYNVKYIIVAQMERGMYDQRGIQKFADYDGTYWHRVYSDRDTAIYQVDDAQQNLSMKETHE